MYTCSSYSGLLFSILVAILDSLHIVKIKLDASFIQDFFMLAFFTTIGLGASLKLFKIGRSHASLFHVLWNHGDMSKYYRCISLKF